MKALIGFIPHTNTRTLWLSALGITASAVGYASYKDREKYRTELPKVAAHSKSINEFISYTKSNSWGRYVRPQKGFYWKTSNPEISGIINKHFSDLMETFGVAEKVAEEENPTYKPVRIVTSNSYDRIESAQTAANISAGGISALWSAYLQSVLYKKGAFPEGTPPPVYIMPKNIKQSAYFGSSTQFHVSHAAPMYTDSEFSTAKILKATLARNLFPTKFNHPESDNYMIGEIHPSAFFDPDVIKVGLGYLFHEMKYKFQSGFCSNDVTDETMPLAVISGKLLDDIASELGSNLLVRGDTFRVAYNASETKEMLLLKNTLKKYGVDCNEITFEEAKNLSGTKPDIWKGGSIWEVKGDGNMMPDTFDLLLEGIKRNGGQVIEGEIEEIIYDDKEQKISGVVVTDSTNSKTFIQGNRLYTSFGAKAKYHCPEEIQNFQPVEPIISGTGYSSILLVTGNIKKPIDSNNSHFTPIRTITTQDGTEMTLVKATSGGAIGTDSFCIDHAVNNLHYATEIIFPGKKVEIIAAKSCNRPLNGKNSGIVQEVLPGFFAGTGFGGKGVTDAPGFALTSVTEKLAPDKADKGAVNNFVERYGHSDNSLKR